MKKINVLISTYFTAFIKKGGGEMEMLDIAEHLKTFNFNVFIYGSQAPAIEDIDVLINFSINPESLAIVEAASELGKTIILWPNIWLRESAPENQINIWNKFADLTDFIVFKTKVEIDNLSKFVSFAEYKILKIHTGVDPAYSDLTDNNSFKKLYSLSSFILWTGLIEEAKNQLFAIQSLKDLPTPIVFIGGYRDRNYFQQCIKEAPKHFLFLPYLKPSSSMLTAAYSECDLFLELSSEPPGASALEARMANKQLILSRSFWADEIFGRSYFPCDPYSASEINETVNGVISQKLCKNYDLSSFKKKHLLPQSLQPLIAVIKANIQD